MAGFRGNKGGNFKKKIPKLIGRGILESIDTDGPHTEWLGMPPYYIHHIVVEGEKYSYLSADPDLMIDIGKKVTFRYRQNKESRTIEKRSLGIVIDPSELGLS